MSKRKEKFSIHNSSGYRQFFENNTTDGYQEVLTNLQPHMEQLRNLDQAELELLIAHCKSIENRQKQPQLLGIFTSLIIAMLGLILGLIPKPLGIYQNLLLFIGFAGVFFFYVPQIAKQFGNYMENLVYVTLFREIAEVILKELEDKESAQNEATEAQI